MSVFGPICVYICVCVHVSALVLSRLVVSRLVLSRLVSSCLVCCLLVGCWSFVGCSWSFLVVVGGCWLSLVIVAVVAVAGAGAGADGAAGAARVGRGEGVYASNASPCVRSKRFRVYRHQAHMFHTCGLGARTHADVLNVHTVFFLRFFTVPQHTNTNTHTPNTHHDHTTQQGDRNRERKTREETRQEGKTTEERR